VSTERGQLQNVAHTHTVPAGVRALSAAMVYDGSIEVVSTTPPTISRLQRGAAPVASAVDLVGEVLSATYSNEGWVMLVSGGQTVDSNRLLRVSSATSEPVLLADVDIEGHLSAEAGLILLTQVGYPFRTDVFDHNGRRRRTFKPGVVFDGLPSDIQAQGTDNWVSLPTLAVDRGFVQTFADVTSDWRVLALYDDMGRPVRTQPFRVPLGFLLSRVDEQTLVGSRRLNRVEVVRYSWRWKPARPILFPKGVFP